MIRRFICLPKKSTPNHLNGQPEKYVCLFAKMLNVYLPVLRTSLWALLICKFRHPVLSVAMQNYISNQYLLHIFLKSYVNIA